MEIVRVSLPIVIFRETIRALVRLNDDQNIWDSSLSLPANPLLEINAANRFSLHVHFHPNAIRVLRFLELCFEHPSRAFFIIAKVGFQAIKRLVRGIVERIKNAITSPPPQANMMIQFSPLHSSLWTTDSVIIEME